MNNNLANMTNSELKAYIKVNRNNESACHEALKLLISRRDENTPQYSYNLANEEMESLFQAKLRSKQSSK